MLSPKATAAMAVLFALDQVQAQFAETTVVVIDQVPAVAVRTVYATSHITVFGCPPWEVNCPVHEGATQAVVTATVGATTTVCPLTLSQARLSVRQGAGTNNGGQLQTTTTRWPTLYSIPSSFPDQQTSWDPAIWASIFPSGAPAFSDPVSTGSFADGDFTGTPFPLPTLDSAQAALLGVAPGVQGNLTGLNETSGAAGGTGVNATGQSVTMTTGSFAAILSSNLTSYVTTLNAFTANYSAGGAAATTGGAGVTGWTGGAGVNGTVPGSPTTLSNATVAGGPPVSLQTVNVSPAVPVNLFSLLVALSALAFAL